MAAKGSDVLYDFCCNVCEEENLNKEAMFYCQQCSKGLCYDCIGLHKQFYKMHVANWRGEIEKWPIKMKLFEELKFCQQHNEQPIEMYCEDHSKLCCSLCLFHEHRHCVNLVLIKEKSNAIHEKGDFHTISATIADIQKKLETAIEDTQECLKELQDSYYKAYKEIKLLRQKINDILDELERKTIISLDKLLQTLNESIQSDADKCTKTTDGLKKIYNAINDIENCPNDLSFIAYQRSLEMVSQAQNLLKELTCNRRTIVMFQRNPSFDKTLSELSSFGNIECVEQNPKKDNVMIIECKSKNLHNVRITSDKTKCDIRGILELPGGDILIADYGNKNVKLFDETYKVVTHIGLSGSPFDICSISPTEVAVTINERDKNSTVQFLGVNNRKITKGMALEFKHDCRGIAYLNTSLFITSFTALYQYTLGGQLVKKIYEDTSDRCTVYKCAVSADGSRLYVTNHSHNRLLTVSIDGTVLSSMKDPALDCPRGVHVSETGQLLVVCENGADSVVQVDGQGGGVVTLISGLNYPETVYYNVRTGRLIIVQLDDNIMIINSK